MRKIPTKFSEDLYQVFLKHKADMEDIWVEFEAKRRDGSRVRMTFIKLDDSHTDIRCNVSEE